MRWPLQPLQPFQQTQLQAPFGQSVASLCHPWFTTTNFSYRFPIFETSATALCGTTGNVDTNRWNRSESLDFPLGPLTRTFRAFDASHGGSNMAITAHTTPTVPGFRHLSLHFPWQCHSWTKKCGVQFWCLNGKSHFLVRGKVELVPLPSTKSRLRSPILMSKW